MHLILFAHLKLQLRNSNSQRRRREKLPWRTRRREYRRYAWGTKGSDRGPYLGSTWRKTWLNRIYPEMSRKLDDTLTGLVKKGKFTGNPWVFTIKYRAFL
jgi:hypothetical protein